MLDNQTWDIINVYVLTSGTACLSGKLKYNNGKVTSGAYMIGITPETIKWIPLLKKGKHNQGFSVIIAMLHLSECLLTTQKVSLSLLRDFFGR